MHRQQEMSQVTEDDVNEVKGDISTLRFELLDVFKNNGMDISSANKNSKGFTLINVLPIYTSHYRDVCSV